MTNLFGDRAFLRSVLALALPLVVQQGITSLVGLLDNIMVGGLGTASYSAVGIVNQLIFVYNLALFGGISGAAIYGAQFAGKGDDEGLRYTFRFRLYLGILLTAGLFAVMKLFPTELISLFLSEESSDPAQIALALREGQAYLEIALWCQIPFMLTSCFSGTLKEAGETFLPMVCSVLSILMNLVLNWVMIYGNLGCPAMGVRGAAWATLIARCAELLVLVILALRKKEKYTFLKGLLKSLYIPAGLAGKIAVTAAPLMANELVWSTAMTAIQQSYSLRGLSAVAAVNIAGTVWNMAAIIMFSMANVISIMVGQELGRGDIPGARRTADRLVVLDLCCQCVVGVLLVAVSSLVPEIYNTEPEVRSIAAALIRITGFAMPIHSLSHASYFVVRCGGRIFITILMDSAMTVGLILPAAALLARFTAWPVEGLYAFVQFSETLKAIVGVLLVRSSFWARNLVGEGTSA